MKQLRVVTEPAEEPVSLAETKLALRIDVDEDDYLLDRLIAAVRDEAEGLSQRALVSQTLEMALPCWPASGVIELPRPPLASVTSITYYDSDNVLQTMPAADYVVSTDVTPGTISLAPNGDGWPSDLRSYLPIRVMFVAGYGEADAVPAVYKQLIIGLVSIDYENRDGLMTGAVRQRENIVARLRQDGGWYGA